MVVIDILPLFASGPLYPGYHSGDRHNHQALPPHSSEDDDAEDDQTDYSKTSPTHVFAPL